MRELRAIRGGFWGIWGREDETKQVFGEGKKSENMEKKNSQKVGQTFTLGGTVFRITYVFYTCAVCCPPAIYRS